MIGPITITRMYTFTQDHIEEALAAGVAENHLEEAFEDYCDHQVGMMFDTELDQFKEWITYHKDDYE